MLMYPEEPLSPLPPPDVEGKITLAPVANYWLDAEYSPRDPVYEFKGDAPPSSGAYRYKERVFQAFTASTHLGFNIATWWAAGTLNVPATWEEAVSRAWNIYSVWPVAYDSYGQGYLSSMGWKDVLFGDYPKLNFISVISAPISYHCYHYPEQSGEVDGFRYYARADSETGKGYRVNWFYLPDPSPRVPSIIPVIAPLIIPILMGAAGVGAAGVGVAGFMANAATGNAATTITAGRSRYRRKNS